jgi:hypothetical protein
MANRTIKDSIWRSNKLAKCSMNAQLHYPRLYLLVDDWSCMEIDLTIIKGIVYPKIPEIAEKHIESYLMEYQKNGLLFIWQDEQNRTYGYFTGDEPGRLPRLSKRHKRHTPEPPSPHLEAYLDCCITAPAEDNAAGENSDLAARGGSWRLVAARGATRIPNPNPIKENIYISKDIYIKEKVEKKSNEINNLETEKKRPPKKRREKALTLSNFTITPNMTKWLEKNGDPRVDPETEVAKFIDHHQAKGNVFKDLNAAFRNWIRKAIEIREKEHAATESGDHKIDSGKGRKSEKRKTAKDYTGGEYGKFYDGFGPEDDEPIDKKPS